MYSLVKIDFLNENDNHWCVDAWKTDDPNEEGTVVARIDNSKIANEKDPMSIIEWEDKSAMNDEYVRETIISFIEHLKID